jgi:lysozyme
MNRPLSYLKGKGNEGEMRTNKEAIELIKRFEGCKLMSYICPAGKWTIGYGSTWAVHEGQIITQAEANRLLLIDIESVETGIDRLFKVKVSSNQYSACVCLAFNIGVGNFRSSTLLKLINQGDLLGAASEFLKWDKGGKPPKAIKGLTERRKAERELFLKE